MTKQVTESYDLVDIRTVKIKRYLPKEERIIDYLKQVKNPYKTKWRDYTVEVVYNPEGVPLKDCLKRIIHNIQNNQE